MFESLQKEKQHCHLVEILQDVSDCWGFKTGNDIISWVPQPSQAVWGSKVKWTYSQTYHLQLSLWLLSFKIQMIHHLLWADPSGRGRVDVKSKLVCHLSFIMYHSKSPLKIQSHLSFIIQNHLFKSKLIYIHHLSF